MKAYYDRTVYPRAVFFCIKCVLRKAKPEEDLRYFSNRKAVSFFEKAE